MEILCDGEIKYNGQPVAIVIAETEDLAYKAVKMIDVEYSSDTVNKNLCYTVRDALKVKDNERIKLELESKPKSKGSDIKKVIKGNFDIGSQYHYTMETQTCVTIPVEDGIDVYPSAQWMDLCHQAISKACNIPESK